MTVCTILLVEFLVIILYLPETFQGSQSEPIAGAPDTDSSSVTESTPLISPPTSNASANRVSSTRNVILVISSYMLFEISWVFYSLLFILYIISPKPTGPTMDPGTLALVVFVPGLVALLLQLVSFTYFVTKFGLERCYCTALLLVSISFCLNPFIGFEGVFVALLMTIQIVRGFANMILTSCSLILVCLPVFSLLTNRLGNSCLRKCWARRTGCCLASARLYKYLACW